MMAGSPTQSDAAEATSGSRVDWHTTSALIDRLAEELPELERSIEPLELAPLADQEWYEQLRRKLQPQLSRGEVIVAAVVGGTNIGKSMIFNHLAGASLSAISSQASGTKHPVCLVPTGFRDRHELQEFFPGFELHRWESASEPLQSEEKHLLFTREVEHLPPDLLLLDTPDVDSDAPVNWERADRIRQCADVLVAVLTQQKYNDAAVKQFFRKGSVEGKSIFVVFNRCQLPLDEEYWPKWLRTFQQETGVEPVGVYIAPNDRPAAEENRLPFYRRQWPRPAGKESAPTEDEQQPVKLIEQVTRLHFDQVKRGALKGALRLVLDAEQGLPKYLQLIQSRSEELTQLSNRLTVRQLVRVQDWPSVPSRLIVQTIRGWWRDRREGWTRSVHEFYNTLGEGLMVPLRWAYTQWGGKLSDPFQSYLKSEREVILASVDHLYHSLQQLRGEEIPWLHSRLNRLLGGVERQKLLQHISDAHASFDLQKEIHRIIIDEMEKFETESPQFYTFLKRLDVVAAAARPMTTVALFFAGGVPGIDALAHETATQFVLHIAGGTGTVVAGETALMGTTGGLRVLEAKFHQLETAITTRRVAWFADLLKQDLFGEIQQELDKAGTVSNSERYRIVAGLVEELQTSATVLN